MPTTQSFTESEDKNAEERLADSDPMLRRELSSPSGIIGLTNGIVYTPSQANVSPLTPNGFVFPTVGMSNGYSSSLNASGITDFTAYNPYIHHVAVGAGVTSALNNAGIYNAGTSLTKVEIMNSLVLSSQRFEIYSREFRG